MSFSDERRRWGLAAALRGLFMRHLASTLGIHVFLVNARPLAADPETEDIASGHEIRYLEAADVEAVDGDAQLNLPRTFIQAAWRRGDVCIGCFDAGRLVSYFWCAFDTAPMEAGLWVRVPPGHSYAYKALTVASHRGRRLQQLLTSASDRELVKRGLTHNIEYMATYNYPQRVASARYGNRTIGLAGYVQWGRWVRPFRTPRVKARRFAFFLPNGEGGPDRE